MNDGHPPVQETKAGITTKQWVGILLVIACCVFYALLLFVPFFKVPTGIKAGITTGMIIVAELCFIIGVILLGKPLWNKYKPYLNPLNWFKKRAKP